MRTHAMLYVAETQDWMVIFQDDYSSDKWYVEYDHLSEPQARQIVDKFNVAERVRE